MSLVSLFFLFAEYSEKLIWGHGLKIIFSRIFVREIQVYIFHVFENHFASHLPSRPPPTALYWGDPRHPQKGSIVRYLVALEEIPTLRTILFRG